MPDGQHPEIFTGDVARMHVRAPAKLNLTLAVGGRRSDGYHDLVSVMEPIDLCDELEITVRASVVPAVHVSAPDLHGGDTLVHAAVSRLLDRVRRNVSVDVELTKRIPVGAGLGGGSSDAATAIRAVHSMIGSPLSNADLHEVAAEVGSDVPFFLTPIGGAVVRGRGDVIEPLPADVLPRRSWLVAWPGSPCLTGDVYDAYTPARRHLPDPATSIADAVAGRFHNDLAEPALESNPAMRELHARMSALDPTVAPLVAGSGSSIALPLHERSAVDTTRDLEWLGVGDGIPGALTFIAGTFVGAGQ